MRMQTEILPSSHTSQRNLNGLSPGQIPRRRRRELPSRGLSKCAFSRIVMVKFGKHLLASRVGKWADEYVDYGKLKTLVHVSDCGKMSGHGSSDGGTQAIGLSAAMDRFRGEWLSERERVNAFFEEKMVQNLGRLYAANGENIGHALMDQVDSACEKNLPEMARLFQDLMLLKSFARLNSEALQKLIKKWDKHHGDTEPLSGTLLPKLYVGGIGVTDTLDSILARLSESLLSGSKSPKNLSPLRAGSPGRVRRRSQERRNELIRELGHLKMIVETSGSSMLGKLVAHRGFHAVDDTMDRPVENTLEAMEHAWGSGVRYCECDIACTFDGQLVLAHDSDMSRLSLLPEAPSSSRKVQDLTFKQLVCNRLKNGSRPPLLSEILEIAMHMGPDAKLVVEIKYSPIKIGTTVAKFLIDRPHLLKHCAAIISFDLFTLHEISSAWSKLGGSRDSRPLLFFLTVNKGIKKEDYEVSFDFTSSDCLSDAISWLKRDYSELDGLYVQYDERMVTEEGAVKLRQLCSSFKLGVWGSVDNHSTASSLVDAGVTFVNTDLAPTFLGDTVKPMDASIVHSGHGSQYG